MKSPEAPGHKGRMPECQQHPAVKPLQTAMQ